MLLKQSIAKFAYISPQKTLLIIKKIFGRAGYDSLIQMVPFIQEPKIAIYYLNLATNIIINAGWDDERKFENLIYVVMLGFKLDKNFGSLILNRCLQSTGKLDLWPKCKNILRQVSSIEDILIGLSTLLDNRFNIEDLEALFSEVNIISTLAGNNHMGSQNPMNNCHFYILGKVILDKFNNLSAVSR